MEFFNHWHCKFTGVKRFVNAYEDGLRYRYMITEKAKYKAKVLVFWEKHGLEATMDAFPVKRSTLFLWKKKLKESGGKLESLNNASRSPKNKRKRIIPKEVKGFVINQRRLHPRLGKEKIAQLLREEKIASLSASTVGRMINDLKQRGELPKQIRLSLYAKTGNLIEKTKKKTQEIKKKRISTQRNWRFAADRHHCEIHQWD